MRKTILLIVLAGVALANVNILSPTRLAFDRVVYTDFDTQSHYLGNETLGVVAPGQTVVLVFDRQTGDSFLWTNVEFTVPDGWTKDDAKNSTRDISNITASFTLPREIPEGRYSLRASVQNDIGVRATEEVDLYVDVTNRVFTITPPEDASTDAGEPAPLFVSITNNGIGSDVLILGSIAGLPARWTLGAYVPVGAAETKQVEITSTPLDEGKYRLGFQVKRTSSDLIDEGAFSLRVYPTLKAKLRAISEGFDIIPMILQPLYSLLSFFGL
ncbi:hypothetical protein HY546_01170 [archaeon]|nr:hypothetical protein [archaeon]